MDGRYSAIPTSLLRSIIDNAEALQFEYKYGDYRKGNIEFSLSITNALIADLEKIKQSLKIIKEQQ